MAYWEHWEHWEHGEISTAGTRGRQLGCLQTQEDALGSDVALGRVPRAL